MNKEHYRFSNLEHNPEALQQIKQLEQKLAKQVGEPVTLIAYSPEADKTNLGCRAGLDD